QCRNAASERAAWIARVTADEFLRRRHRDIKMACVKDWRADNARQRVLIRLYLPKWLPADRVNCVEGALLVSEIGGELGGRIQRHRPYADRGTHRPAGVKAPVSAPGSRIEREHPPSHAGDVDPVTDYRRLTVGHDPGIAESPFWLELSHVLG